MPRRCKICEHSLRPQIEKLMSKGASCYWVSDWCNDKGFKVAHSSIIFHMENHVEGYKSFKAKKSNIDEILNDQEFEKAKTENLTIINLDSYLDKLGLTREELLDIENNLDKNITAFQSAINLIMFKNLALVDNLLQGTLDKKEKYPQEKIRGLKNLSEIWFKATGIDTAINQNIAYQMLEKEGYEVKKVIDISSQENK